MFIYSICISLLFAFLRKLTTPYGNGYAICNLNYIYCVNQDPIITNISACIKERRTILVHSIDLACFLQSTVAKEIKCSFLHDCDDWFANDKVLH